MKFKIVETGTFKRSYEIEAKNSDEALDKMYSGDYEPIQDDEDGDGIWVYYENGSPVENCNPVGD